MLLRRKLPRASFILLSCSLVCALAAAGVMLAYARRLDAARPDGGPPVELVAAGRDLPRGVVLTEEVVEVVTLPSRFAPGDAFHSIDDVVGRSLVTDLAGGEILTGLRLAGGRAGPTASLVPAGLRAVQVPVTAAVGVEVGDRVDVIATFGGGGARSELAGEGLEVLRVARGGAGGSFGAPGAPAAVGLVLLVTPDEAERLAFASAFATLSIAVRGPDEPPFGGLLADAGAVDG